MLLFLYGQKQHILCLLLSFREAGMLIWLTVNTARLSVTLLLAITLNKDNLVSYLSNSPVNPSQTANKQFQLWL